MKFRVKVEVTIRRRMSAKATGNYRYLLIAREIAALKDNATVKKFDN